MMTKQIYQNINFLSNGLPVIYKGIILLLSFQFSSIPNSLNNLHQYF